MRQERHEHERRDRNAQRPFHVFANHFISFRSNLQKRAHAPKVATVYLAITTSLANGARGPAVGEPGLEHPADHRADRGVLPQGVRGARRGRGRRAGLPRLPLRAPRETSHQQRAVARQPRAQAPRLRGAGLPQQEVAHQDDGSGVLRDGRGLGRTPPVQRRPHRQGRRGRQGERACLRGPCRRARGRDHRTRRGR